MLLNFELDTDAVQQSLDAALKKALSTDSYGRNVFYAEVQAIIARGVLTADAARNLNSIITAEFSGLVASDAFRADVRAVMREALLDAAKRRAVKKVGPLLPGLDDNGDVEERR